MRRTGSFAFATLAWLLACSSFGSDPVESSTDAGSDVISTDGGSMDVANDVSADVEVDAGHCSSTEPFKQPVAIGGLPSGDALGMLSPDERAIYIYRGSGADTQLYFATRPNRDSQFATALELASLNTAIQETHPAISADGLTILFGRGTVGQPDYDLYIATRASTAESFGGVKKIPDTDINTGVQEVTPYLTPSALYFASKRAPDTLTRIYRAARIAGGGFGAPTVVSELEAVPTELLHPVPTIDELTIYFGRTTSADGFDIYMATRATMNDKFSAIQVLTKLQTNGTEVPTFISADNCRLYFMRIANSVAQGFVASRR